MPDPKPWPKPWPFIMPCPCQPFWPICARAGNAIEMAATAITPASAVVIMRFDISELLCWLFDGGQT